MATWDDLIWYGKESKGHSDLRICPFNNTHKLRPTNYDRHVLKCEQSHPSHRLASHSSLASVRSIGQSLLSVQSIVSDMDKMTGSFTRLSTSESSQAIAHSTDGRRCLSPDSAIDMKTNSSADNTENEDLNSHSDGSTVSTQNSVHDLRYSNGMSATSSAREPAIPIVPQVAQSDCVPEKVGAGDPDDWNNANAPHFDIYEGFENCDELTDEQIVELGESFIDTILLNKLDKPKRKVLYQKLIELKKTSQERRKMAIKELLSSEELHPQIKDIPQEIRKPKVDVRDLFNFKKDKNKDETLKKNTVINTDSAPIGEHVESPKQAKCPYNPWTIHELTAGPKIEKDVKASETVVHASAASESIKEEKVGPKVDACCNNCWTSLSLTAHNVKKMTVFCDKCSGIKFGGYFECQQCKLYGYFAMNQIEQHLNKHFLK